LGAFGAKKLEVSGPKLGPQLGGEPFMASYVWLFSFSFSFPIIFCRLLEICGKNELLLVMDDGMLSLCAGSGLVDASYISSASQARAQRQALFKKLLSHVSLLPIFVAAFSHVVAGAGNLSLLCSASCPKRDGTICPLSCSSKRLH